MTKNKIIRNILVIMLLLLMASVLFFYNDWLNANSDALMVLITFVYVVATVEICKANIKSAEATKEQLEESKRQFEEDKRLQMMPYFEIMVCENMDDSINCIKLDISNNESNDYTVIDRRISIKNIGLGAAKNFTYIWCNLDGCFEKNDLNFTAFAPGEQNNILFDFYAELKPNRKEYRAPVSIVFSYCDLLENKYNVELKLEFVVEKDENIRLDKYCLGAPTVTNKKCHC